MSKSKYNFCDRCDENERNEYGERCMSCVPMLELCEALKLQELVEKKLKECKENAGGMVYGMALESLLDESKNTLQTKGFAENKS